LSSVTGLRLLLGSRLSSGAVLALGPKSTGGLCGHGMRRKHMVSWPGSYGVGGPWLRGEQVPDSSSTDLNTSMVAMPQPDAPLPPPPLRMHAGGRAGSFLAPATGSYMVSECLVGFAFTT